MEKNFELYQCLDDSYLKIVYSKAAVEKIGSDDWHDLLAAINVTTPKRLRWLFANQEDSEWLTSEYGLGPLSGDLRLDAGRGIMRISVNGKYSDEDAIAIDVKPLQMFAHTDTKSKKVKGINSIKFWCASYAQYYYRDYATNKVDDLDKVIGYNACRFFTVKDEVHIDDEYDTDYYISVECNQDQMHIGYSSKKGMRIDELPWCYPTSTEILNDESYGE